MALTPHWYDDPVDASVTAALFDEIGYAVERHDIAQVVTGDEDCLKTI